MEDGGREGESVIGNRWSDISNQELELIRN